MSEVKNSIEVSNSEPILGYTSQPDIDEIKRRAKDSFATQSRAVTGQDLESSCYMMPSKYGSIKRCASHRSSGERRRNVNLYVLSEDNNGQLILATETLKQNLKMWLGQKKMMGDTVDIKDAKIINYGIEFNIIADSTTNKYEVLNRAIEAIKSSFSQPLYIGEKLYITDIYSALSKVRGVVDAKNVKINFKSGTGYSSNSMDINSVLSSDGLTIETPQNVALEMKYTSSDINGSVS